MAKVKVIKIGLEKMSGDYKYWGGWNDETKENLSMAPNPFLALSEALEKFYRPKKIVALQKDFADYLEWKKKQPKKK